MHIDQCWAEMIVAFAFGMATMAAAHRYRSE